MKKKILLIVPHLSTGGLPQVALKRIEALSDNYRVKCVEYSFLSDIYTVQREKISNILGEANLVTLGDDKSKILELIEEYLPDFVWMEEFPEFFMDPRLARKIYGDDRKYRIIETTHDSSFKPSSKIWMPDKFIFVSVHSVLNFYNLGIPYDLIEYPVQKKVKNKGEAQGILGLDPSWKHVVNVGLFTQRKNQGYVFELAKKMEDKKVKFHFLGNQADNFRSYWEPLMKDKPDNCVVWGERKDVDLFLEASDLFIFPSRGDKNNKELNPIAIKEAIEHDVPVLMYNLDVYCGKYDQVENVKFLNGDPGEDSEILMDLLGVRGEMEKLFSFDFNEADNRITIKYKGNKKFNFNVSIRDLTSKAPMYWFNLPLENPVDYWVIPIPAHVKKFKNNPNFRGFLIEFYDADSSHLVFGREIIVNTDFYPNIPEFKFNPLDCNYINYYEFFVDKCFDSLGLNNLDTVIDIGANVGLFAKYMYSINAKKVILVEANPYLRESIECHLDNDLEKSVIYMNPIYKEKTKLDFRFSKENSTIGSNVFDASVGEYGKLTNLISCDSITLDEIYRDNNYGRISLFKCDIEGGEYPLFESITDDQISLVDRFMVEFHENTKGQINIIMDKLERNNFECDIVVYELGKKIKSDKSVKHGVIFARSKNMKLRKPGTLSGSVYSVTEKFEEALADYTGAPYVVTVDNQSNALFLSLYYENIKGKTIVIPNRTYPSVPCEIIHAGGKVEFENVEGNTLKGAYQLYPTRVWDSALRFTSNMYIPNSLMCLSFTGPYKHLKLGKGGAILTDDYEAYKWFKRARYSGRNEISYHEDNFDMLGWNFYMMPELASRGLLLMNQFYNLDGSPKHNDDIELPYPDLSKFEIYK